MHFKYIGTERAVCACPTKHRSLQWHWLSKVGQLVSIQWFSVATSLVLHHSVQPVLFVANQTNQLKDDGVYMYIQLNSHFIFILGSMMLQTLSLCVSNSNDLCYSQIHLNCLLATGDSVCFVTFWYFYTPSWSLSGIYAWPVHVQSFRTHPRIWMTVTETRFRDDNQAIQWKHASVETI